MGLPAADAPEALPGDTCGVVYAAWDLPDAAGASPTTGLASAPASDNGGEMTKVRGEGSWEGRAGGDAAAASAAAAAAAAAAGIAAAALVLGEASVGEQVKASEATRFHACQITDVR